MEDRKKLMVAVAKQSGLGKNEFRKYVDEVHPDHLLVVFKIAIKQG